MAGRLIFLTWAYPPMNVPRAIQVARLADHLGRPVEIVCAAVPAGQRDERVQREGLTIRRVPDPASARLAAKILPRKLSVAAFMPDPHRAWAMEAARMIVATGPLGSEDLLVTFGQPMSVHLAGLRLKRQCRVRWIAHFSDPWVDNPLNWRIPLYRFRNRPYERDVIELADRVLFPSAEMADLVMTKYPPAWGAKQGLLPHAFDPALFPPRRPAYGRFVLRYLGNLYSDRGPGPLFDGLAALLKSDPAMADRIAIELIGDVAPRFRNDAGRRSPAANLVTIKPPVDYATSLALMRSADLLLNIDAPAAVSVFLPSKLVEYIGARRAIFGITPEGTAAAFIRAMGGWVADPASPAAISTQLAAAVAYLERHRESDWGDPGIRASFEAPVVAARLSAIIDAASAPSARRERSSRMSLQPDET